MIGKKVLICALSILYIHFKFINALEFNDTVYFCTFSDAKHFPLLINLIGSIHKNHFDNLGEIAVFNIGLNKYQINQLKSMAKVNIYDIELTHPDLLKYVNAGKPFGNLPSPYIFEKWIRGWYAWKPVAIKQASELFPYFLSLDAGIVILRPINHIFSYIKEKGFFTVDCGHSIRWMITEYVKNKFGLNSQENKWILAEETYGLSAGIMGINKNIYKTFVLPMYELTKDLENFNDDGSAPNGFGTARHDQTLFSIYARFLKFPIFMFDRSYTDPILIESNNEKIPLYITESVEHVDKNTHICLCRWNNNFYKFESYIQYK